MGFYTPNDENMTVSRKTIFKGIFKRSAGVIKLATVVIILFYLILAFTLVRFIPGVAGGAGVTLVKNPIFYGDVIPANLANNESVILIDTAGTHDGSFLDNAKSSFMVNPHTAIVDVKAGPAGKLKWEQPNILSVNDEVIPAPMSGVQKTTKNPKGSPINEKDSLYQEYVGICQSGNCIEGEAIIFHYDQVLGVPVFK